MSCRCESVPFSRKIESSARWVTDKFTYIDQARFFDVAMRYRNASSFLVQQQIAALPDRHLRRLGKPLQQPGQRHFQPDMIVRDIEMA